MSESIEALNRQVTEMWWRCSSQMPDLAPQYDPQQQQANARKLAALVDTVLLEARQMGRAGAPEMRAAAQDRIMAAGFEFGRQVLGLSERQLNLIQRRGFIEVTRQFAQMARQFDPTISADDIYQASRNVMTMNFMQLLLDRPVEMTPSVFAYSMLYPYTDNYLDDAAVKPEMKRSFNERFHRRLAGENIPPRNPHEEIICSLVEMIESQYNRKEYPAVYESLLAIHAAQARSLQLSRKGASPFEQDVIGITFEKGGTSVLADGYLVAGDLTSGQAAFMYAYGSFTQMMDDLEDVTLDRQEGAQTIFSQTAGHWPLDSVINKALQFGRLVFSELWDFQSRDAADLLELIQANIHPAMFDSAYQQRAFFSAQYLKTAERAMPFPFAALEKQRRKLARHKTSFTGFIEMLI